jgi:hypothetical protein
VLASFGLGFSRSVLQINRAPVSMRNGTEKASRMAIDESRKLIGAGKEKD